MSLWVSSAAVRSLSFPKRNLIIVFRQIHQLLPLMRTKSDDYLLGSQTKAYAQTMPKYRNSLVEQIKEEEESWWAFIVSLYCK